MGREQSGVFVPRNVQAVVKSRGFAAREPEVLSPVSALSSLGELEPKSPNL